MADGVVGGDTITHAPQRRNPMIRELLWDYLMRMLCERLEHRWTPFGRKLPFGTREYCDRCGTNRITFDADGEQVYATAMELIAADTRFGEALYEARWGDPPRRKLRVGEWPAL